MGQKRLYNNDYRPAYTQNNLDIMPFGTHKGKFIADTPRSYREWMLLNFNWTKDTEHVKERMIWANMKDNGEDKLIEDEK